MIRTTLGVSLAALATTAASWALGGPIVTRGSAALPTGCSPAAVAGAVAARAKEDEQRVVYVAVLPNRRLAPRQAELRAGMVGASGASVIKATADCSTLALLTWDATAQQGPFTSAGPCPQPKGWKASGPTTIACAGLPTAWETSDDFTVKAVARQGGRCDASVARTRVISLLHALDYGTVTAFGAAFIPRGTYQPYTASVMTALAGRAAITAFAKRRIAAADGWTASSLLGPIERTKKTATTRSRSWPTRTAARSAQAPRE